MFWPIKKSIQNAFFTALSTRAVTKAGREERQDKAQRVICGYRWGIIIYTTPNIHHSDSTYTPHSHRLPQNLPLSQNSATQWSNLQWSISMAHGENYSFLCRKSYEEPCTNMQPTLLNNVWSS